MDKKIVIILVDYHGYKDTVECIESIEKCDYSNYRIVVVDNTSDSTYKLKSDSYMTEHADVIEADENLGFSGGNNIGIKYAQEKYNPDFYVLLNNDTIVTPEFLNELLIGYYSEENVGLVTGKITMYPETDKLWYGGSDFNQENCLTPMQGYGQKDVGEFDNSRKVTFATGCLWLFHKSLLDRVGLMDDRYFLYCEDVDYCLRVVNTGLSIIYWPKALIGHKESIATGKNSPRHQYYLLRNQLEIIRQYGKHKVKAYSVHLWIAWKGVLRGRRNFTDTFFACRDFFWWKLGKNKRYTSD